MSVTAQINELETRAARLQIENDSLLSSNEMLTEQVQRLQSDLLTMTHKCEEATRVATEVQALIEGVGRMAIDGITKMRAAKSTPLIRTNIAPGTASALPRPEYSSGK